MTPAIAIITVVLILISLIAGIVVTRKHRNAILGVFTMLGGTAVSIAAAVIFSNYEPAETPDSAASDANPSVLDDISMLFAEAFNVLILAAPVLLIACIFSVAMHFAKDPLER